MSKAGLLCDRWQILAHAPAAKRKDEKQFIKALKHNKM